MSSSVAECSVCKATLARGCFGLVKVKSKECASCQKTLCPRCAGELSLIPFDAGAAESPPIKKTSLKSYCRACFERTSVLDYSKTHDVIEAATPTGNPTTLLWVHGGGSCRAMFRPHATSLAAKGYRSILVDLPGHGTLADTALTLDSCVDVVRRVLDAECGGSEKPTKVVYVGGSLGAYIGFHVLGQLKGRFAGAVLIDCGQNVGPDCSLKARLGIWFLRKISGSMSNKGLMEAMMGTVEKSKADYHLVETCYGAGMFFQQGPAQCDCMHAVAPADVIPHLQFPMLFFNGSKDYRDSENKWLALCKEKQSSLKVYEGGDHFFCHDSRFVDDMLGRMDEFVKNAGVQCSH